MLQVFDDLPVFELPDGRREFRASASVCEVKLEIGEYPPVFLDENSAAGSAAQGSKP